MAEEQSEVKRTEIHELGEFALIEHLSQDFVTQQTSTIKAIGDDAAVIHPSDAMMLVSTDLLIEGIHFDLIYTPLKHLGYKCVVVNLSDIYAMNAFPTQITVSIAVSNRFSVEALEELYDGIRTACDHYKVDLIGGDTTSSPKGLVISITAIGKQVNEKIVYRSGAKHGDQIYVSGELGAAYLGLQLLEREKQIYLSDPKIKVDLENQQYIIGKFLKPEAARQCIFQLAKAEITPTCMIDLSDGLSSDLLHICKQSNCGAIIFEENVPINTEAQLMAIKFNLDPITCALNGGEDYELLFTASDEDSDKLRFIPGVYHIGEIVDANHGIKLRTNAGKFHPITAQGWKHF